jgi:hypothetical protein
MKTIDMALEWKGTKLQSIDASTETRVVQAAETPEASSVPENVATRLLRLYVARPTPSSIRAEANLAAGLATIAEGRSTFRVEIVDAIQNPHQAIKDRVIVTPCLIVPDTNPPKTLAGDLQDARILRLFLEEAAGGTA